MNWITKCKDCPMWAPPEPGHSTGQCHESPTYHPTTESHGCAVPMKMAILAGCEIFRDIERFIGTKDNQQEK